MMKEFIEARTAILNHITHLDDESKSAIETKLNKLEKLLTEENKILARQTLANVLTLLLKFIPSTMTTEITRSFSLYLIFMTMLARYFPEWGIYQTQKVIIAHGNQLKTAILEINNITKEQVDQKIHVTEDNINNEIEKYESREALIAGAIGHVAGVMLEYSTPLGQLGIFKPVIQGGCSTIGYGIGAEIHYYQKLAMQRRQQSGQPRPGLSINDLLITIRGYITHVDGFAAALNEIASADNKNLFIKKCMHLVDKGWNNQFLQMVNFSNIEDIFFRDKMDDLLNNPLRRIFSARTDLTQQDAPIIRFFVKLQLYRLIYEAAASNQIVTDLAWLCDAKKRLDAEFNTIATQQNMTYNGRVLRNQNDINLAVATAKQQLNTYHKYFPLIATFAIFYYLFKPFKDKLSTEANITISLLMLGVGVYLNRTANTVRAADRFLRTDIPARENQQQVITNENVLKFYQVTPVELQKLQETYTQESVQPIRPDRKDNLA